MPTIIMMAGIIAIELINIRRLRRVLTSRTGTVLVLHKEER